MPWTIVDAQNMVSPSGASVALNYPLHSHVDCGSVFVALLDFQRLKRPITQSNAIAFDTSGKRLWEAEPLGAIPEGYSEFTSARQSGEEVILHDPQNWNVVVDLATGKRKRVVQALSA